MKKKFLFYFLLFGINYSLFSQSAEISFIVSEIKKNNPEIKYIDSQTQNKDKGNRVPNYLPNPDLTGFYLPFGQHTTGDYWEFQFSQSFEFPSVYGARRNLNQVYQEKEMIQLTIRKKEIIYQVQTLCLNLYQLDELEKLTRIKAYFLEQELRSTSKDQGSTSEWELKSIRINLIEVEHELKSILIRKQTIIGNLSKLNNGNPIEWKGTKIPVESALLTFESFIAIETKNSASGQLLDKENEIALQTVEVERKMNLPNFIVGYNYQGDQSANFHGFYGGIILPLWGNKSRIGMAQKQQLQAQLQTETLQKSIDKQQLTSYNRYRVFWEEYAALKELYEMDQLEIEIQLNENDPIEIDSDQVEFYLAWKQKLVDLTVSIWNEKLSPLN